MNRRGFSRSLLASLGLSALGELPLAGLVKGVGAPISPSRTRGHGVTGLQDPGNLRIDGERINGWLEEFSRFGRRPDGGVDRVALILVPLMVMVWAISI